jgi:hypothetical protein
VCTTQNNVYFLEKIEYDTERKGERERERAERHKRKREHNKPTKCVKGSARGILRKS